MQHLGKMNSKQLMWNLFFCIMGCFLCYILQKYLNLSNVLSSILVGLTGSFIPSSKLFETDKAIAAIYCGSFASMSGLIYFKEPWYVFILGIIVGLYFTVCSPFFRGIGGKLGSIAFLSLIHI